MPLYMDFHILPDVTIEEVKHAHIADKAVQDKYHVKYHQFWVNERAGTVFCLMEGPSKEACEATHREAHGNVACKMEEVSPGMYNLFMGEKQEIDQGLVRHKDGTVDVGYRYVLVIDIYGNTKITHSSDYKSLRLPVKPKNLVFRKIEKHQGKSVKLDGDDTIVAVFVTSRDATQCAISIYHELDKKAKNPGDSAWDVTFKMGLSGGQPLTRKEDFFEKAINLSRRLSMVASNKEIMVSALAGTMSEPYNAFGRYPFVRIVDSDGEKFIDRLFDITENNLGSEDFSVRHLSRDIGISRPQLYRKTTSLTGKSPNDFIQDIRMQKALALMKEKHCNISEIALQVGYNNPSYFSRRFRDKYGISPSKVII